MARFELKLPKMGESVAEATITSWLKEVGETIEADEAVLEIATDKVDSEVPSEVDGVLTEVLFNVDDVVQVGQTIAVIETEGEASTATEAPKVETAPVEAVQEVAKAVVVAKDAVAPVISSGERFYSPLVKNMAKAEGIEQAELDAIPGTGKDGRVTKNDMTAKALRDFPMMNISLQGDTIIKKKNINLGMAAALPDGNLIVPVIKNADQLNLVGMTKQVNDLANRARENKLKPDDIQGGTYTVTNVGTFGSIMGTPIINQPQVGILALGAIRKVPAVIETPDGDFIGIRYKMFMSQKKGILIIEKSTVKTVLFL